MKKLLSFVLSGALLASAAPFTASADGSSAEKNLYFKLHDSEGITVESDGTIVLTRSQLKKLNRTIKSDVFFRDEAKDCWNISAKWKCASKFVKLSNVANPLPSEGEKLVYAYAAADDAGNIIRGDYATVASVDTDYNVAAFTCRHASYTKLERLVPYGEATDSYPLTSFDINIDMNVPYGDYSVYFLMNEEDYKNQQTCSYGSITDDGFVASEPSVTNMKIKIVGSNLGDIDNNGSINSIDASLALTAYSNSSTGGETGLNELEFEAADIDGNNQINSTDASDILAYYSYVATSSEPLDFSGYLESLKKTV